MKIKDVMKKQVIVAAPDWSVGRVIELMLEEDVSSLLIVDESGRLVGIVTESVLLVATMDSQLRSDPVSLHMERKIISCDPEEWVTQTIEKFLLHRVRHFPVVENGKLIGIITRRDLMRALLGQKTGV